MRKASSFLSSWALRTGDVAAVVLAAALMLASAGDHVYLWDIAYRHVATLGPLFIFQAVTGVVLALTLVVTRLVVVMLVSVLFLLSTIGGFILADTVGLFGFTLPSVTQYAWLALSSEAAGVVVLTTVLVRHARERVEIAPSPSGS